MERLILCGGGHVSLELAHIAGRLEFELIVIDDRPEFANESRFPMARRVICAPFLEALAELGSREDDYYCLLTRGHVHDRDCLEHVLRGRYAYIGMIGSRAKVAAVKDSLAAAGFAREALDGVCAPIGLPIGGQTPAEIAVSIAAQLVQVRSRRGPAAVPPPEGEPGVLCTITAKHGSTPRGVGTWMLVRPDGTVLGTIGGGAVEFQAVQEAKALWERGGDVKMTRHYDLSPDAASLGNGLRRQHGRGIYRPQAVGADTIRPLSHANCWLRGARQAGHTVRRAAIHGGRSVEARPPAAPLSFQKKVGGKKGQGRDFEFPPLHPSLDRPRRGNCDSPFLELPPSRPTGS